MIMYPLRPETIIRAKANPCLAPNRLELVLMGLSEQGWTYKAGF